LLAMLNNDTKRSYPFGRPQTLNKSVTSWDKAQAAFECCKTLEFYGDDVWSFLQYARSFLIGVEWNPGPRKGSKGNRRRNRSTGGQLKLTMVEASDRKLATRSDMISFRGKSLLAITPTATPAATQLTPISGNLGTPATNLANAYARYRIVRLMFRATPSFASLSGTGSGAAVPFVIGCLDDWSGEGSTNAPTTVNGVLSLRSSVLVGGTDTKEFEWKPLDVSKWYYTYEGAGDQRFVVPVSLYVAEAAAVTGQSASNIEVHFTIEFAGLG